MSVAQSFDHSYISFTSAAQPFVRADDVGFVVSEFLCFDGKPYYPIGALAEASIAPVRLSTTQPDDLDEDNLDLIFRMREVDGGSFFEIVLRSHQGTTYGGWAWGRDLVVLNESVNDHRVLVTSYCGGRIRFTYCQRLRQYKAEGVTPVSKTTLSQRALENTQAASPAGVIVTPEDET